MERLSDSVRQGGSNSATAGAELVPREQLMEMEAKAQYLDEELQRQAVGRADFAKLEAHARSLEEELSWYKEQNQVLLLRVAVYLLLPNQTSCVHGQACTRRRLQCS